MKFTVFALTVAVAITFSSVALSDKTTKKAPEGVELIGDDRAVAKKGYRFSLVNELKAQSHAASEGSGKEGKITGEYQCTCTKGSGDCKLTATGTSLTCKPGNQCEKCEMKVTLRERKISP